MKAAASSPEPKPAPPPPPPRRRRTRSSSSSSTTAFSSSSSSSSIRSSPSPSHYSYSRTPFHSSSSSIPFSWEKTPGIPKPLPKTLNSRPNPLLPLPPPLRSDSFDKLAAGEFDPFAAALVECAKDTPAEESIPWIGNRSSSEIKSRRRFGIGDRFGFGLLDLYGSCKASCSVAESAIKIPKVGQRVAVYRVLNRRVG